MGNLRNKFSQSDNILNFYSNILKTKSKINKVYNNSIEIFLLKFSDKHKNY